MADLIKKIKIKKQDGTFTDYIPIGAEAKNVDTNDGDSVQLKLNKKPYYYNNVAEMKADKKLKVGDMAITLGYYEPNDGGSATYLIKIKTDTDIEDNGLIHFISETLVAELIINENTNVKQFGAYGDNIHDDSNIINKFIQKFGSIHLGFETWKIENPIIIDKENTSFICDGLINYTGNNSAFKISGSKTKLIIKKLQSNGKGFELFASNLYTRFVEINCNFTYAIDNVLYINGDKPVYHILFNGLQAESENTECVYLYIPSTTSKSYISEINIINCIFENRKKNYAIKAICDSSSSEIQYSMRGGSLEGTNGIYSSGMVTAISLLDTRIHEFNNRQLIKIDGYMGNYNIVSPIPANSNMFDFSNANYTPGSLINFSSGYNDKITGYRSNGHTIISKYCAIPQEIVEPTKIITENTEIMNVFTDGLYDHFEVNSSEALDLKLNGYIYSPLFIKKIFINNKGTGVLDLKREDGSSMGAITTGKWIIIFGGSQTAQTIEYKIGDIRN